MILRALILGLIASLLAGCPYDRVHPPYLQNKMNVPVDVEIVLLEGVVSAGVLEPGGRLGFGYHANTGQSTIQTQPHDWGAVTTRIGRSNRDCPVSWT